jgi:serine/threonine protein kinase
MQVYEMLAGKPLFPPNLERGLHMALMIVSFGDFPADLIRRGRYSSEFFTKGAMTFRTPPLPFKLETDLLVPPTGKFFADVPERLLLADRVNNFFSTVMDEEERRLLNDFLGAMLKLEPSERSSPADLVSHKWLRA